MQLSIILELNPRQKLSWVKFSRGSITRRGPFWSVQISTEVYFGLDSRELAKGTYRDMEGSRTQKRHYRIYFSNYSLLDSRPCEPNLTLLYSIGRCKSLNISNNLHLEYSNQNFEHHIYPFWQLSSNQKFFRYIHISLSISSSWRSLSSCTWKFSSSCGSRRRVRRSGGSLRIGNCKRL